LARVNELPEEPRKQCKTESQGTRHGKAATKEDEEEMTEQPEKIRRNFRLFRYFRLFRHLFFIARQING